MMTDRRPSRRRPFHILASSTPGGMLRRRLRLPVTDADLRAFDEPLASTTDDVEAPVIIEFDMEPLRESQRWRAHVASQRARAQHMRESRWERQNLTLYQRAQEYRASHPGCGRTEIVRAVCPRADARERRRLVARLKRLDERVRRRR